MFAAFGTDGDDILGVRGVVGPGPGGGLSLRGFGMPRAPLAAARSASPKQFFLTGYMIPARPAEREKERMGGERERGRGGGRKGSAGR